MHNNFTHLPDKTDVCIIGAGPAGTTTSLYLSRMGIPHVLIDKDFFPRDKICGDGLDPNSLRVLYHYNPDLLQQILAKTEIYTAINGVRVISPNQRVTPMFCRPLAAHGGLPIYITGRRAAFDTFLQESLDNHFAKIHMGTAVVDIVRQDGGLLLTMQQDSVQKTVFTPIVIGADGDHSIVQRKLDQRKIERHYYAAALRCYYKGVSDMHPEKLLDVYLPRVLPMGYFWIFPMANGEMNVGLGMSSHQISKRKVNLREEMQQLIEKDKYLAPRFANATPLESPAGWGLPLAARRRTNYGDNYLLVGDAGSLINPLSGEGIGSAMISGVVASHFVRRALETRRFDAESLSLFQRESSKRLNKEINFYRRIVHISIDKWQHHLIDALVGSGVARRMFESYAPNWMNTVYTKPIEVNFKP